MFLFLVVLFLLLFLLYSVVLLLFMSFYVSMLFISSEFNHVRQVITWQLPLSRPPLRHRPDGQAMDYLAFALLHRCRS